MTPVHVLAASGETLHERLFVALAVVVVSARLFGGLAKRIGQPSVVGEIAAGIVLGPSCLAAVAAGPHEFLFPPEVMPRLGAIADVGLVLFMFLVGRDVDVASIRRLAPKALVISPVSIAVPMALGWLLAGWMYPRYGEGVDRTAFCLFVGTCMAITAFPCWPGSCRRRACRARPWGSWPSPVPRSTTSSPGACSSWSRRWSTPRGRRRWRRRPRWWPSSWGSPWCSVRCWPASLAVPRRRWASAALAGGWLTSVIGIHAIFGAFAVGVVFPRSADRGTVVALERTVTMLLLPVFFVIVVVSTRVGLLSTWSAAGTATLIVLVTVGKWVGCALATRGRRRALGRRRGDEHADEHPRPHRVGRAHRQAGSRRHRADGLHDGGDHGVGDHGHGPTDPHPRRPTAWGSAPPQR